MCSSKNETVQIAWSEIDIFFRGAGDIIGATKLDEAILAEMLREEEAGVVSEEVVEIDPVEINVVEVPNEPLVEVIPEVIDRGEIGPVAEPEEGWFGVGRGEEE